MSEINVTPMVDVMLVLLIVFMVAAPLMTVGVADRPARDAGAAAQHRAEADHRVGDARRRRSIIGDQPVALENARRRASPQQAVNGTEDRIYVRGDTTANYGAVMKVMGVLSGAGYSRDRSHHGPGTAGAVTPCA